MTHNYIYSDVSHSSWGLTEVILHFKWSWFESMKYVRCLHEEEELDKRFYRHYHNPMDNIGIDNGDRVKPLDRENGKKLINTWLQT